MSFKFSMDTSDVEKKIANVLNMTKNFRPFFAEVLGDSSKLEPWTLRGGVHRAFAEQKSPNDASAYTPLSPRYKAWKDKNYSPDLPIHIRTGHLYESLVYGNEDSVLKMTDTMLVYGTKTEYAAALHYGYIENNLPSRRYMSYWKGQINMIKLQLRKYVVESWSMARRQG